MDKSIPKTNLFAMLIPELLSFILVLASSHCNKLPFHRQLTLSLVSRHWAKTLIKLQTSLECPSRCSVRDSFLWRFARSLVELHLNCCPKVTNDGISRLT